MIYLMSIFLLGLVLGLMSVASNPAPYFAALGLVVVAGVGCGVLLAHGGSYLALILFLIYLGGMLVVFAYSAALAADPYPESWGSRAVSWLLVFYLVWLLWAMNICWGEWYEASWVPMDEFNEMSVFRGDIWGVALLYSVGGGFLILGAWMLVLALFGVLELTRGLGRGALRVI